jgi:hypothetical protein
MQIKKYIDNLQENVDVYDVNVRLQLLEKVWEEYNAVQDQLEYDDDDDEMQQHELDREAVTETYCEVRARIDRIIADNGRAGEVQQNHRRPERCMKIVIHKCLRLNCPLLKFQNLEVE